MSWSLQCVVVFFFLTVLDQNLQAFLIRLCLLLPYF